MEQTRVFLAENRQSMVGIFKRFAKIGGVGAADHHGALSDLAKCYMTLISATNFLEVCTQPAIVVQRLIHIQYEDEEVKEPSRPTLFS